MKPSPLIKLSRSLNLFKKQLSQQPPHNDFKDPTTPSKGGLLRVLNSYIHPPLPLTPRQKHILLSQITTSFRKHLAADQTATLNVLGASTVTEDEKINPLSQETQKHFAAVVNSPAFTSPTAQGAQNSGPHDTSIALPRRKRVSIFSNDLEVTEKRLRGLLSRAISSSPVTQIPNISRDDSSLELLVSLCRNGGIPALRPPTEQRSLKNWLVAGLLLSNRSMIPLRWIVYHLSKRDYGKTSALIWALIQTWLRIIGDTGTIECFLSMIGFRRHHAEQFPDLAPIEGPLLIECRRLLVSPPANASRMLFKIAKQLFQKLKQEDARKRLVQAIEIWNPAPHNLALTAHLSLKYCNNYDPGVNYLVSLGELGPRDYAFGEDDTSHNSFRFRLELCLRILGAIAKTGHVDLLAEMVAIIQNRLRLCPDVSVAREVLEHLSNKNILPSIRTIRTLLETIQTESFPHDVFANGSQDMSFPGLES